MNDEFLHALRREPPPRFASELKRRLDRQSVRSRRVSIVRATLGVLLIGGVAMAAVLLFRDRPESSREDTPVAQEAPRASARSAQPADTTGSDRQPAGNDSAVSQPPAEESASKDIPVALVTSSLARPLAQALLERLPKYGYFAQPRVATMEGDSAFDALCGSADFVVASRRISEATLGRCRKWGIDVAERKLGYQAVVVTAGPASEALALTPRDVFLALALRIPDPAEPSQVVAVPNRLVVVDYSFYAAHRGELRGSMLEGPAPTLATLTDGTYPAARPVYVYAQRSHLDWNPAARTLAYELTRDDAVGPQGYLLRQGLVPLEDRERYMQKTRPPVPSPLESLQP